MVKHTSELVDRLKPIIKNARISFIRETDPRADGRRQYTADIDQAIADDVVEAINAWNTSDGDTNA